MALVETGIRLTIAGEAAYRAGLKGIANEMKTLQTQSKLAMAQLGNNAGITDKYRTSQKYLGQELELVKNKSTSLKNEQEKLSKVYSDLPNKLKSTESAFKSSAKETERLENNYKQMKKSLGEMHPETQKVKQAWEESKATTAELKNEYSSLSKELNRTEKELAKLPDQIARTELASQRLTNQMQKEHEEWRKAGGRYADTAKKYQDFGDNLQNIGGKLSNFGSTMTTRFTLPIATGFGLAVKQASAFQTEIGMLGPLIAEGGNITADVRKQMDLLGESSRKWAVDYGKHTTEINAGMAELIRNGYTSNQVLGMVPNILDASVASGEDFNVVMGTTANVLSQFNLRGKDTNETLKNTQKVVDSLTYVANATSSGFYDLGEGLAYVGPVANTLNMSVAETASILGILSDNGIQASQGGTALRGALSRLLKPSKQNAAAMEQLGINTEDYKNGLIDFPTILDTIAENTKNLTNEQKAALIAQAFGVESQSAMNALVNAGGDALRDMTKEAEGATGATKEIAEAMKELPEFKFQQSLAQLRDLGIELGNKLLPIIMDVVETATDWVQAFTEMDDSTQDFIIKAGLLLAAIGPVSSVLGNLTSVAGGASKAIGWLIKKWGEITTPKGLIDMKGALDDIPGSSRNAAGGASVFSNAWSTGVLPLIGLVAGLALVIKNDVDQAVRDHKESVSETNGAYKDWFNAVMSGAKQAADAQAQLQKQTEKTGETYKEAADRIMNQNSTIQKNIDSIFKGGFLDAGWSYHLNGFNQALVEYENLSAKLSNIMSDSEIKRIEEDFNSMAVMIGNSLAEIGNSFATNTPVTATWAKAQVDAVNQVADATKTKLAEQRDALIQSAQEEAQYHQNSTQWLAQETARIESEYSRRTWVVENAQNTIQTILQNASKQNRALTEQDMASMVRSFQDLAKVSGQSMTELAQGSEMVGEAMRALATDTGLAFMEAQGMIDSETANMIRSMSSAEERTKALAEALDKYDQIQPDPKTVEVETRGEENLQRLVELFGGDWASLTDEQKTALANAEGYDDLAELLYEWGLWKADSPVEAKQAVLQADPAIASFQALIEQAGLWNNTEFLSKLAYIDTNGPEAKEEILALVAEWSGIPLEEIKQMHIDSQVKGAEESKQKIEQVKQEADQVDGKTATTKVEADTSTALQKLTEIIIAHSSIGNQDIKNLIVNAQTEEAQNQIASTIAQWAGISESEAKQLLIDAQTELANQKLSETESKKNNLATPTSMSVTADTLSADGSLTHTKMLANELDLASPDVVVNATDNASPVLGDVALGAADLQGADPNIFITATDNTNGIITAQKEQVESIPDSKSTSLSASIGSAIAGALGAMSLAMYKQSIEDIPDSKTTTITVNANGVAESSSKIKDYNTNVTAMQSKSVTATTSAPGLPGDTNKVDDWNKKVAAMKSNSSTATTNAPGLPNNTSLLDKWNSTVNSMKSNSSTATTSAPGLPGNTNLVYGWINALNSTYSKSSTLTTYVDKVYRTFGRHAEGGHIGLHAEGGNIKWGGLFAGGGNVPQGYMGIVGEAGPELFHVTKSGVSITPLSSGEKMRGIEGAINDYMKNNGGGANTNINVQVSVSDIVIRDDRDIDLLAKAIGDKLNREVQMTQLFRKGRMA